MHDRRRIPAETSGGKKGRLARAGTSGDICGRGGGRGIRVRQGRVGALVGRRGRRRARVVPP